VSARTCERGDDANGGEARTLTMPVAWTVAVLPFSITLPAPGLRMRIAVWNPGIGVAMFAQLLQVTL
jgi:hypothetical protein